MNPHLTSFFDSLLRASWQAAILALLVLVAEFCLRQRLDGRWRYLLWLLVLVRLALPFSPPSPASLFNYVRLDAAAAPTPLSPPRSAATAPPFELMQNFDAAPPSPKAAAGPPILPSPAQPAIPRPNPEPTHARFKLPDWPVLCALIWAAGAAGLMLRLTAQNARFYRRLQRGQPIASPPTLELFQDCQSRMGVHGAVRLIDTDAVRSPALYGLFHPQLLLPVGLTARFSGPELRHVFLHELAHIRRRDMVAQWLVMVFQVAHWFNPILWLAFRRMAAARELACDELALSISGEAEGRAYGETIIKLLETCSPPAALPGLVGILEDKNQMFQRIGMIARFKQHSRWSFPGLALAAALAVSTLTSAQTKKALDPESGAQANLSPTFDTGSGFQKSLRV